MSAPVLVGVEGRCSRIRGTPYPVLLPTLRDPRLHLAAVIVSLQVLGQVAFGFSLSIAQILVSLLTCAVLEFAIAFRRQRVIMWPASALLTGNGVAFVLRVPGTQHGDWWSLRGAWIFAATAAVALLSKYLIRFRGRHVFNPSNIGLVVCFLALGKNRADPLDFWWAPMSTWMALALVIIVIGGLADPLAASPARDRRRLLGRLRRRNRGAALTGHAMTARWHLGEITGGYFWRILVLSPEVLVFLFFMITDPKTIPDGTGQRRVYAVGVGLLAALLIAPQRTEFASKVALLGALAIVCAARPLLEWLRSRTKGRARPACDGPSLGAQSRIGARCNGTSGRPDSLGCSCGGHPRPVERHGGRGAAAERRAPAAGDDPARPGASPRGSTRPPRCRSRATSSPICASRQTRSGRGTPSAPLRAAAATRLARLQQRIRAAAGRPIAVPTYSVERMRVNLEPRSGPGAADGRRRAPGQNATHHVSGLAVDGRSPHRAGAASCGRSSSRSRATGT